MSLLNTIFSNPAFCNFGGSMYLLFSSNVPPLVHYSHIPITIISLLLGFFVFFKNRKGLPNRILFCLTLAFSAWVFLDSIFWASNRSDVIMFVWSLQILFEPIVYLSGLYLLYVLIRKEDMPFNKKLLIGLIYLPLIILVPTRFSLSAFNIATCLSEESPIIIYLSYGVEILLTLLIVGFSIKEFTKSKTREMRQEILILSAGTILLLLAFSSGNIISSFTEDWRYAQIGLFAMPVFIGILVYGIVKFKTFNIKLFGAQALIAGLIFLIGAQFFFIKVPLNFLLNGITFTLILIFGTLLVKSVKHEVAQRERIEKLAKDLEAANERLKELDQLKSEFVSMATHQIRGPLTAIKGYASMMRDGDYGIVPENLKGTIDIIYESSNALTVIVQDFLDISRIEQGNMKYEFTVFDFSKLVQGVGEELAPTIERKGLRVKLEIEQSIMVYADAGKVRQVVGNLIDNAIKYTPAGSITVILKKEGGLVRLAVKDTGVGINPETLPKLFQKFSRAEDASKANVLGTGLGLYVAKKLMEAQSGRIWAESEGEGKGSAFFVELPLRN